MPGVRCSETVIFIKCQMYPIFTMKTKTWMANLFKLVCVCVCLFPCYTNYYLWKVKQRFRSRSTPQRVLIQLIFGISTCKIFRYLDVLSEIKKIEKNSTLFAIRPRSYMTTWCPSVSSFNNRLFWKKWKPLSAEKPPIILWNVNICTFHVG